MIAVGVLVRVERGAAARVSSALQSLPEVSTLPLEEPDALGAVIRCSDPETAESLLRGRIERVPGVLCAWPVHVHDGGQGAEASFQPEARG